MVLNCLIRTGKATVCHFKKVVYQVWAYFHSHLAYTMAMINLLVQWDGIQVDENGCVYFSLVSFSF